MIPLHGIGFFGFNILRFVSVIATVLVLSSTLMVMVLDGREYNAAKRDSPEDFDDCEYLPGTDVPTHTWGIFWVQLDRTFVLILLILCVLSEINWGGRLQKSAEHCFPILGRNFGTGPLGALQMMVSTNLLSHYLEEFPLVTAWLLAIVGFINFHLGLIFRQRQRDYRSMSPKRRALARDGSAGQVATKMLSQGLSKIVPGRQADMEKAHHMDQCSQIHAINERQAYEQASLRQQQDILRSRARQDNAKAELVEEVRQASSRGRGDTSSIISGAFLCDSTSGYPVAVGRPHSRATDRSDNVAIKCASVSRQPSISQWSQPSMPLNMVSPTATLKSFKSSNRLGVHRPAYAPSNTSATSASMPYLTATQRSAIKRRSLALARAARKRLSIVSSKPYTGSRSRKVEQDFKLLNVSPEMNRATDEQVRGERQRLESLAKELKLGDPSNNSLGRHGQQSPPYEAVDGPCLTRSATLENERLGATLPAYQAKEYVNPAFPASGGFQSTAALPIAGRYQSEWTSSAMPTQARRTYEANQRSYNQL
ncbi:unnamed protein product [Sympodiomycopsis kandeliae]